VVTRIDHSLSKGSALAIIGRNFTGVTCDFDQKSETFAIDPRTSGGQTQTMLPPESRRTLPRVLGLWTAIALVIGSTIGTGVFVKPRIVAQSLGSFDLAILTWTACGILAFFGTMALAELAALFPQAGGNYVYLTRAFGPLFGFLWGWIEFWVMRSGSIAALAWLTTQTILFDFLQLNIPAEQQLTWMLTGSLGVVVGLTLINAVGLSWGGFTQNLTTALKVGTLLVVIALPFFLAKADPHLLTQSMTPKAPSFAAGLAAAMVAILWAYKGWADLGSLAEDVKEPQRNLPRAFGIGIAIIIALYVGANIAYSLVLSQAEMAAIPEGRIVAAVFVERLTATFGPEVSAWSTRLVSLAIAISALGAMNSSVLVGPRNYFALARDGLFPRWMSTTSGRETTPLTSILVQSAWTCLLIVGAVVARQTIAAFEGNPFDLLTDYVVLGALIFETLAVAAVFRLRQIAPDLPRPFRCWGYPWAPALHVLAMAFVLEETLRTQPWERSTAALGFILIGFFVYVVFLKHPSLPGRTRPE
jgi:amino acid transporter